MLHRFVVAIGAGCAAALLFVVSAQSSILAMALAYLAPLPIMIATLGWGLDAGAIAAAISIAVLAVIAEPLSAVVFAASVAVPAWALAAFSVTPLARYLKRLKPNAPVHAPVGAIVSLAALLGMLGGVAVLTAVIVVYGGYSEGARHIAEAITTLAGDAFESAPGNLTAREFADALVRYGPMAIAASTLMMLCVNLYGAARSTQLSRNLPRPWPDVPSIARASLAGGDRVPRLPRSRLRPARSGRAIFLHRRRRARRRAGAAGPRGRARAVARPQDAARSCWLRSTPAACCGPNTPFRFSPASASSMDSSSCARARLSLPPHPRLDKLGDKSWTLF